MSRIVIVLICTFFGCFEGQRNHSANAQISFEDIVQKAEQIDGLKSLLISKRGQLIGEAYFQPYPSDSLDHVRSVTKSVMGLLIGIAIDRGIIGSIDDPIALYIGDVSGFEDRHRAITIRHLLTMSAGFEWDEDERTATYIEWVRSVDPVKHVLRQVLSDAPGDRFEYNSASSHLLSLILTKASGQSTLSFAKQYLFNPLQIDSVRWQQIAGYYNGGAGLELKPRDMVRLGQLVTNEGTYNDKRIMPAQWIRTSTEEQIRASGPNYGYLWWTEKSPEAHHAMAIGFGGQLIAVLPEHDIVVTTTANWLRMGNTKAAAQLHAITTLIGRYVYPFAAKYDPSSG